MVDIEKLKERIRFHLDDRDACEYTGDILPRCLEAIEQMQAVVDAARRFVPKVHFYTCGGDLWNKQYQAEIKLMEDALRSLDGEP